MLFVSWACVFVLVCQCSYYFSCSCRTAQTFFFFHPAFTSARCRVCPEEWAGLSCMPVILCMPPHAHTGLHMTSIWEQWNSDLITNSLLLIKTWCLAPSFALFFFASVLLALACLLVVCSPPPLHPPPHIHTHPTTYRPPPPPPLNSRVAPFCGFAAACCQKGPHFEFCRKL